MSGSFEFTIQQAVCLLPACIAVHFLEEAFGFATWARSHISPRYTYAHWRKVHGLGLVSALAASAVVSLWTRPVPIFLFTALFLTPMVFNSLFHLGTSVLFRRYSPGTTSALVLFPRRVLARGVDLFAFRSFERRGRAGSYSDRCRRSTQSTWPRLPSSCIGSRHDEADQDPPLASHQVTSTTAPLAQ